jgi:hypothetical protein
VYPFVALYPSERARAGFVGFLTLSTVCCLRHWMSRAFKATFFASFAAFVLFIFLTLFLAI